MFKTKNAIKSISWTSTLGLALVPMSAAATSSFTTPAAFGALETVATSSSTWTQETGFNNTQVMRFDIPTSQNTIDITIDFPNGAPPLMGTNGECALEFPFTSVTTETLALTTVSKTNTQIVCRIVTTWINGMGREFNLGARSSANGFAQTNSYGFVKIGLRGPVGQANPMNQNSPAARPASQVRYSGPEFSSFGPATLAGNKLVASGKKLDSITSMQINGKAVTYKINSASELEIDLPKDLAPGKYDVEINSIHGKLTHLQGITIKAVVPTKELAFKAEGAWLNYGSLLELTNIAKQIGSEYTSVKCIANAPDPVVAERLAKRACSYIEANRLRGKAVTYESKSTYKGEGFWVRVVANG